MTLVEIFSAQLLYKLVVVTLIVLLLLTLLSLFGDHLYLELTTHFRLQYAIAAITCCGIFVAFHSWRLLFLAILCASFNLAYVAPYYLSGSLQKEVASGTRLRIMHINVLDTNQRYDAFVEAVEQSDPDILVVQELTSAFRAATTELERHYPFSRIEARQSGAGMGIFSRYPLLETSVLTFDTSTHVSILARANINGRVVSVLSLHPPTPMNSAKFANRNRQLTEAAKLIQSIDGPRFLIGDLNTTMWSPYFRNLLVDSGLRDVRKGFGLETSWPTALPGLLRLPIDHCLVSPDIEIKDVRMGKNIGSDHLPLIVDASL